VQWSKICINDLEAKFKQDQGIEEAQLPAGGMSWITQKSINFVEKYLFE
jgi:hypothetical protein